jgi:predicted nucleic acid-binding protein
MKYVLDSNAALKWVLPETDGGKAIRIRDDFKQGIHDLYVILAEREGCGLLTADDRLVRALQGAFPFITSLASLP